MRNLTAVVLWFALVGLANAQAFPAKPVKLIVPYAPGSAPDVVARILANRLQGTLGQPFLVDNRSGAAGNIGADAVAKAAADGYTLLVGTNGPVAVNQYLFPKLPYDPTKDFAAVSMLAAAPQVLAIARILKADTIAEFIEYVKKNPDKVAYASPGAGSASHLTMELFKHDAGLSMVHVPYRGFGPAMTNLLAGDVQALVGIITSVLPHVRTGALKALAVTAQVRSSYAPDIPSVAELGFPQLESLAWIGLFAPSNTPAEIVGQLNAEFVRALHTPEVESQLTKLGFEIIGGTPTELDAYVKKERVKWSRVIRASGITAE